MSSDSDNISITQGGHICYHLLDSDGDDPYQQFTGVGTHYNLICTQCKNNPDDWPTTLRHVSREDFEEMDRITTEGIVGQPEIFERSSDLSFVSRQVKLDFPFTGQIRSVVPLQAEAASKWVALLASGKIVLLDFEQKATSTLATVSAFDFELAENAALHLSHDGRFSAIVNDHESHGIVVDLTTRAVTLRLNRGTYHAKQTRFPVAFFQHQDKPLLVHATQWNRLDISNPATGALLTVRTAPEDEKPPAHYLDYFHDLPMVSPDALWIAEDGWVWSPVGITRLWNLQRWLTKNVWESEDGASLRYLIQRAYHWESPLCWIDGHTLAVWGFGDDSLWIIPAVQLFDAATGKRIRWFAGPRADTLYFDEYLFAVSSEGTEVWEITTGERMLHDANLIPVSFHPGTHEFLSVMENGVFLLTRLLDLQK